MAVLWLNAKGFFFVCNLIQPTDYLGVCDNLIQFFLVMKKVLFFSLLTNIKEPQERDGPSRHDLIAPLVYICI